MKTKNTKNQDGGQYTTMEGDIINFPLNENKEDQEVVEQELNRESTEEERMIADLPSNGGDAVTEDKEENNDPKLVKMLHDVETGYNIPDFNSIMDEIQKEVLAEPEDVIDSVENSSKIDPFLLKTILDSDKFDHKYNGLDLVTIDRFAVVLERYLKNQIDEKDYWKELPDGVKNKIPTLSGTLEKPVRNELAREVMADVTREYIFGEDKTDLDTMLAGIDAVKKEFDQGMGAIQARMYITNINTTIKVYTDRLKELESGDIPEDHVPDDIEGAKRSIRSFLDSMDRVKNLVDFKEFCSHVRIKKYDLERPDKIFRRFNQKYIEHKLNIFDISLCPKILVDHLHLDITECTKIALAFCKYCLNMSPDKMEDHTFMYYFIKNIVIMDVIAPRGNMLAIAKDENSEDGAVVTEDMKNFYDEVVKNLKECAINLRRDNK